MLLLDTLQAEVIQDLKMFSLAVQLDQEIVLVSAMLLLVMMQAPETIKMKMFSLEIRQDIGMKPAAETYFLVLMQGLMKPVPTNYILKAHLTVLTITLL